MDHLDRDGFASPPGSIDESLRRSLCDTLETATESAGQRNLLDEQPATRALLCDSFVAQLIQDTLGPKAFVVRATLFDKRPDSNWSVSWHQDQVIAVNQRQDLPGYGPWSIKQGVHHVEPPTDVLARMVAVRIHLDPCPAENGALIGLPGSHLEGRIDEKAFRARYPEAMERVLPVEAGGVLLMKPLCLHRSSRSTTGGRRRVIHFDCAAADLPLPLTWALQERIAAR